jgi:hypothetical protein
MSDIIWYADGDTVHILATTTNPLTDAEINVDAITCTIKKAKSTAEKHWAGGVEVMAVTGMTNTGTGTYEIAWDTTGSHAGTYVARVAVTRGSEVNVEMMAIELT